MPEPPDQPPYEAPFTRDPWGVPAPPPWEPPAPPPTERGLIRKHWRGEYSLGYSYWVMGPLLTAVAGGVVAGVRSSDLPRYLGLRASGAFMLLFFGSFIALAVWQNVGIWRSASKHVSRGGRPFWAGLVKLLMVLTAARTAGYLLSPGIPIIVEGARMVAGIDNTLPYQIRLLRDGTEMELSGGMPFGTAEAVSASLDAAPLVRVIHLNSLGGRVMEARKLAELIRQRGLVTYTSTVCASACSIAFLAGAERYLGENGKLGFHSASIGGVSGGFSDQLNVDFRNALRERGVPDSFIQHVVATPPDELWFPDHEELLSAHVIDAVVDPDEYAMSGVTNWDDSQQLEAELREIPLYSALAEHDRDAYERLRDVFVKGVQEGRARREISAELRTIFLDQLVPRYLRTAPDEPLIRYWRTQVAEMEYLRDLDPQYCADFVFPDFAKTRLDLKALLNEALLQEDLEALAALVRGAGTDPQESSGGDPDAEAAFSDVIVALGERDPEALEVIRNPPEYQDRPDALCRAFLGLYSGILSLPDTHRCGAVLRYAVSD